MSEQWTISRRNFFKVTGLSGASLWLPGCDFDLEIVPSLSAVLTRPQDLVSLRFEFANLQLVQSAAGPELVHDGSGVGYIIVHFSPQHFLEQAVDENAVENAPGPPFPVTVLPPPPVNALIAGPSRLVFKVPANHAPIPYTGAGLLEALRTLELSVAPNATPPDVIRAVVLPPGGVTTIPIASRTRSISRTRNQLAAERYLLGTSDASSLSVAQAVDPSPTVLPQVRPRSPINVETALELPFRLMISPNKYARFTHAATAAQSEKNGRHELWHTRLATLDTTTERVTEAAHRLRTVRAIWTRDFDFPRPAPYDNLGSKPSQAWTMPPDPKLALHDPIIASDFGFQSLYPYQRGSIVHLSSNYVDWVERSNYVPKPQRQQVDAECARWVAGCERQLHPEESAAARVVGSPSVDGARLLREGGHQGAPLPVGAPSAPDSDHRAQVPVAGYDDWVPMAALLHSDHRAAPQLPGVVAAHSVLVDPLQDAGHAEPEHPEPDCRGRQTHSDDAEQPLSLHGPGDRSGRRRFELRRGGVVVPGRWQQRAE